MVFYDLVSRRFDLRQVSKKVWNYSRTSWHSDNGSQRFPPGFPWAFRPNRGPVGIFSWKLHKTGPTVPCNRFEPFPVCFDCSDCSWSWFWSFSWFPNNWAWGILGLGRLWDTPFCFTNDWSYNRSKQSQPFFVHTSWHSHTSPNAAGTRETNIDLIAIADVYSHAKHTCILCVEPHACGERQRDGSRSEYWQTSSLLP